MKIIQFNAQLHGLYIDRYELHLFADLAVPIRFGEEGVREIRKCRDLLGTRRA